MSDFGWVSEYIESKTPSTAIRRVIEVIDSSPEFTTSASAQEVANIAGVNVATVTRCAQFLGFAGWPALKKEIRRRFYNRLSGEKMFSRGVSIPKGEFFEEAIRDFRSLEGIDFSQLNRQVVKVAERFECSRHLAVLATGTFLGPVTSMAYGAEMMGLHIDLLSGPSTEVANKLRNFSSSDTLVVVDIFRTARIVERAATSCVNAGVQLVSFCDRPTPISQLPGVKIQLPAEEVRFLPSLTMLNIACQAILSAYGSRNVQQVQESLDEYSSRMEDWGLLA